jgi:CheY-like chemotaxis protein
MISAADWSKIKDEAVAAGVNSFMHKPLFPSQVMDYINQIVGSFDTPNAPDSGDENEDDKKLIGKRILLAEDIEINQEIVKSVLEPYEVNIVCAENGRRAVELFSANPDGFDIIFMDLHMPEMDGYEATRAIRALGFPRAASIPIIAMTANVFAEDVERCLAAGMNDHIGKPLDINQVIEKIKQFTA